MTGPNLTGADLASAALGLVGTRFRLHGRDPETGLDCIGLFAAAMARAGRPVTVPNGYRLRRRSLPDLSLIAADSGFAAVSGACAPGDVLMLQPSPCQFHLAIATGANRFVHAHAGLGAVVLAPGILPWPEVGHWRPLPTHEEQPWQP